MDLDSLSHLLVERLAEREQRLVLAESCTGGMIAASLAAVPGVSKWLAGSMVVYQEASKMRWLGVAEETLQEHTAVSAVVAHQMVTGVLKATPHAQIAAAVTGHFGPNAPEGYDGLVFIGVGRPHEIPKVIQVQLSKPKRVARQRETACHVIGVLLDQLGE